MTERSWREDGVRVVPAGALDSNTPQTPGMHRAAAITHDRTGASRLWAGTVTIHPGARTGAHHHGELESVIYVVRGILTRSGQDPIVVNLELDAVAEPEHVPWVDPTHPATWPESRALDLDPGRGCRLGGCER